jgi:hypothetical protein
MAKRTYCQITINVSPFEFKKFKEFKKNHNLSAREVLEYSGCPCEKCNPFAIAFDKVTDEEIKIPKGILSKRFK